MHMQIYLCTAGDGVCACECLRAGLTRSMASWRPESLMGPDDPGVPGAEADTKAALVEWELEWEWLEWEWLEWEPREEAGEEYPGSMTRGVVASPPSP